MSRTRSYWACVLSIKYLFRGADQRELTDPPAPRSCYMWTLTFPDALTRGDPRLAMKRWDSFRKWLDKHDRVCLRALERGDKGAFHFHLATPQRWDAREMWDAGERYGFGRVDVRVRPVEAALYLAKYVGKAAGRRWLPAGMRQWGCVGFKGTAAKDVEFSERVRVIVSDTHREKLFDVLRWCSGDTVLNTIRLRPPHEGADEIRTMEIKPAQLKDVATKLTAGEMCAVGEFRGVSVRTQLMEDKDTKQKVDRVLVEFSVELGGMGRQVTEWTKPGTKESDIKLPTIAKGETVVVLIDTVKWYKGSKAISGTVRPLASLV